MRCKWLGVGFAGLLLFASLGATLAGEVSEDPTRQATLEYFQRAVDRFEMGEPQAAARELDKVLALNPDGKMALELRESFGMARLSRLLSHPSLEPMLKQVLARARAEAERRCRDPLYSRSLVNTLLVFPAERARTIEDLRAVGEYAPPELLKRLETAGLVPDRTLLLSALQALGSSAVRPLLAALDTLSGRLKLDIISLLGKAGDSQALPTLKAIWAGAGQDVAVKQQAAGAIQVITGQAPQALPSVERLFETLALSYLVGLEEVMISSPDEKLPIWSWSEEGGLTYRLVDREVYLAELAKQACYRGLKLHPSSSILVEALVKVYASQLDQTGEAGRLLVTGTGREALLDALRWALALGAGRQRVALNLCLLIRDTARAQGLDEVGADASRNPLLRALYSSSLPLRLAAVCALARLEPEQPFEGREQVLEALSWGLSPESKKLALVAHLDLRVLDHFEETLSKLGWQAQALRTGEQLLARAAELPAPRAIFLSEDLFTEVSEALLSLPRMQDVPLVVIAEEDDLAKAQESVADKALAVVGKDASGADVESVVKGMKAAVVGEVVLPDQVDAELMALKALSLIDLDVWALPTADVVKMVMGVLKANPSTQKKLLCTKALAAAGEEEALLALLGLAADNTEEGEVRLASLQAVTCILGKGDRVTADVYAALKALLEDADENVRGGVAGALGAAALSPIQAATLLKQGRIDVSSKE